MYLSNAHRALNVCILCIERAQCAKYCLEEFNSAFSYFSGILMAFDAVQSSVGPTWIPVSSVRDRLRSEALDLSPRGDFSRSMTRASHARANMHPAAAMCPPAATVAAGKTCPWRSPAARKTLLRHMDHIE